MRIDVGPVLSIVCMTMIVATIWGTPGVVVLFLAAGVYSLIRR